MAAHWTIVSKREELLQYVVVIFERPDARSQDCTTGNNTLEYSCHTCSDSCEGESAIWHRFVHWITDRPSDRMYKDGNRRGTGRHMQMKSSALIGDLEIGDGILIEDG
jgi:hypothetical protein